MFFFIPFALYVLYVLYKLYITLKKGDANTASKFATGTRDYKVSLIFLTILATMIGPGFSYGAVDTFYEYGFFYTIFFLLAVVQFWIFGHFFAGTINKISSDSETVGDILGSAYGKRTQIVTGILSVFFSIALVGVLGLAGGKVLASVTELPVEITTVIVVGFVALYSFYGGISTVIKIDQIHFWLIIAFLIVGLIACCFQFFSIDNSIEITNFIFNTKGMPVKEMIAIGIALFLGEAFLPVYSIRSIVSKNEDTAKKAFKKSAYFGFVWFILLTIIGIMAHSVEHNTELTYLSLIFNVFQGNIGGALLIGIALTGMIAVVMSTLDSILNSAGVSFRKDIIQQMFTINEEQKSSYQRLAIILVAVLGTFITMFASSIVKLLIWAYNIWVPAIVFPLAYYLVRGNVKNRNSGFVGAIVGFLGWFLFQFIFPNSWVPAILAGLLLNVTAVLLIEKYGKKVV